MKEINLSTSSIDQIEKIYTKYYKMNSENRYTLKVNFEKIL